MSTSVLAPLNARSAINSPACIPFISVSVSVHADRQRLFQLLTVAEYMEAWLCFPRARRDDQIAITSDSDSFRIDHFRSRRMDFTITGQYRTCRRGKLQFTWRKDTPESSSTSAVQIRLYGDFERTKVCLTHSALNLHAERAWHEELWQASLRRLTALC